MRDDYVTVVRALTRVIEEVSASAETHLEASHLLYEMLDSETPQLKTALQASGVTHQSVHSAGMRYLERVIDPVDTGRRLRAADLLATARATLGALGALPTRPVPVPARRG